MNVLILDDGPVTTMAIPFASRKTAFMLYKVIVLPLPLRRKDADKAINCRYGSKISDSAGNFDGNFAGHKRQAR